MPIQGYVTSSELIEESIDRWGTSPALEGRMRGWIKKAMIQIGALPEVFGFEAAKVKIVDGYKIPKPSDVFVPYRIYLCGKNGFKVEAVYSGEAASSVWNRCCPFYYMQSSGKDTVLKVMDGGDHYFFPNATPEQVDSAIDHAEIMYVTFRKNGDGEILVPILWQEAIMAYIDHQLSSRTRIRDRRSVSHQEVVDYRSEWFHQRARAYGRSKVPNRMQLEKMAKEAWATRIHEPMKYQA